MQNSFLRLAVTAVAILCVCAAPGLAQKYEIHPYAGGQFMTDFESLDLKNPAMFGLKGGVFLTDNFLIEGHGGYTNQFMFRDFDFDSHAVLWEAAGTYNFFPVRVGGVYPYVTFGAGGLTVDVRNPIDVQNPDMVTFPIPTEPFLGPNGGPIPRTTRPLIVEDGDTFFNFSYGGGVKAQRLWGPMGLRGDLRGRTMPNFFGQAIHGFEATGGLLFSWGER